MQTGTTEAKLFVLHFICSTCDKVTVHIGIQVWPFFAQGVSPVDLF